MDPCGLAFSESQEIFVVDAALDCVQVFDRQGRFRRRFAGRFGTARKPTGLAVGKFGSLWVCDAGNCTLQMFQ